RPRPGAVGAAVGLIVLVDLVSYGLLVAAGLGVAQGIGPISLAAVAVFVQALGGANSFMAFDDDNAYLAAGALLVPKVLAMSDRLDDEQRAATGRPGIEAGPRTESARLPADAPRD